MPEVVELSVGAIAHGGHCVARHEGRVVFVRHALPGERVMARVTGVGGGGRYLRADVETVLEASTARVRPPCPVALECGGCDFQHIRLDTQRDLKSEVVSQALSRALHREVAVEVEEVPGAADGLGWRTRIRLTAGADGRAGFHPHRSHAVVPIEDCPIAHPGLGLPDLLADRWPPGADVVVETDGAGSRVVGESGDLPRHSDGRTWQVPAGGFWQVHPGAPATLTTAVRQLADAGPGERVFDLYAGVGLFGGALAGDVGPSGHLTLVESGRAAAAAAAVNLADLTQCNVVNASVDTWVRTAPEADVIVLDPPRSGAGRDVANACAAAARRVIVYVACDPMSLARDAATLVEAGWELTRIRAFDLFPMTHHFECVARFEPR